MNSSFLIFFSREYIDFAKDYIHIGAPEHLSVTISPEDTARRSGEYVTVTMEYSLELMTPVIKNLFSSRILLNTDSTIRVE